MSEQTKAALDAAIAEHIADEHEGSLVTGYYLTAHRWSGPDSEFSDYSYVHTDGQDTHVSLGLLHVAIADAFTTPDE